MCGNIKKLRFPDRVPSDEKLRLAALRFVRKVSGYRVPSRANEQAFDAAVENAAGAPRELFNHLEARAAGAVEGRVTESGAGFPRGAMATNRRLS